MGELTLHFSGALAVEDVVVECLTAAGCWRFIRHGNGKRSTVGRCGLLSDAVVGVGNYDNHNTASPSTSTSSGGNPVEYLVGCRWKNLMLLPHHGSKAGLVLCDCRQFQRRWIRLSCRRQSNHTTRTLE
eukprot:scaffold119168_cov37-Cyclotella_meneghiniana.AAC.1